MADVYSEMIVACQQLQQLIAACNCAEIKHRVYVQPSLNLDDVRPAWVDLPLESLPKLRLITGHLKAIWKTADGPEHVRVLVKCEKLPYVQLYYRKPYDGSGRCKIVPVETKIESKPAVPEQKFTGYTLVCPTGRP